MDTIVKVTTVTSGLFKDTMIFNLFGDRGTVFFDIGSDCLKAETFVETLFDSVSQF